MLISLAQDMTDRLERERQERRIAAMHREMEIAQEIQRSLLPKALRADWVDLLGITSEPPGEDLTIRRLGPGDTLLMFSDGVTEILNPEGQLWSSHPVQHAIVGRRIDSPEPGLSEVGQPGAELVAEQPEQAED